MHPNRFNWYRIEIVGPGGVINHPVAIAFKALKDAGYDVHMEPFDGMPEEHDWMDKEQLPLTGVGPIGVDINVVALPWDS